MSKVDVVGGRVVYPEGIVGDVEDSISDDEGFKEFIAQGIRYEQEAELGYHSP